MSGKREPWREVLLVVAVLIAGIVFGMYAYTRNREDDGVTAIAVARHVNVRGYRLEEMVQRDNPGATLDWQTVAGDNAMVRVAVKAVRENGTTEYRFDVDIPTGRVHAANPHARELLDQGPDPRE
ncbi:MAG: hypothetical protein ACAI38_21800 [Myxococcota bacterium]